METWFQLCLRDVRTSHAGAELAQVTHVSPIDAVAAPPRIRERERYRVCNAAYGESRLARRLE